MHSFIDTCVYKIHLSGLTAELIVRTSFCIFVATIFAYGQTSSGKTYTMRGITESTVKDIYRHMENVSFPAKLCLPVLAKVSCFIMRFAVLITLS